MNFPRLASRIQKITGVLVWLSIAAGCSNPKKLSSIFPGETWNNLTKVKGIQNIPGTMANAMEIQYLGCGGMLLRADSTAILVDPFFSNPGLARVIFGTFWRTIKSDSTQITIGLNKLDVSIPGGLQQTKAIFVSHSHYDHLMDVPAVMQKIKNPLMVYLNQSGAFTCAHVIPENHRTILRSSPNPIKIPTKSGSFEIFPIPSAHNPHVGGIKFFANERKKSLNYFRNPYQNTRPWAWREGQTFSFLIDFKDTTGKIQARIFVQSNSCDPIPAHLPSRELLARHPVDLAFLGVASHQFSENYPEAIVTHLNPKNICWIHWEDFFGIHEKEPLTVRQTNIKRFFSTYSLKFSNQFLPLPGSGFRIKQ